MIVCKEAPGKGLSICTAPFTDEGNEGMRSELLVLSLFRGLLPPQRGDRLESGWDALCSLRKTHCKNLLLDV